MTSGINKQHKEELIAAFTRKAEWDSEYIDAITDLLAYNGLEEKFTKEELSRYDIAQLRTLKKALDNGHPYVELTTIMDRGFNATQMQLILAARDMDMEFNNFGLIDDPDIPYTYMNYAIDIYEKKHIDIPEFIVDYQTYDPNQIFELYSGIMLGLDYEKYLDPKIPAEIMGLCRHALSLGKTFSYDLENKILTIK